MQRHSGPILTTRATSRGPLDMLFLRAETRFVASTRSLMLAFENSIERLIRGWIVLFLLIGLAKIICAPNPAGSWTAVASMSLPFLALAGSPALGYRVAQATLAQGVLTARPAPWLARLRPWPTFAPSGSDQASGAVPVGLLASLIVGLLFNVVVRSLEFVMVAPAINPQDPAWAHVLMKCLSLNVIAMNVAYMACFALALGRSPAFPRILVITWICDAVFQYGIAIHVSQTAIPPRIAVLLGKLLVGSVDQVALSAITWLPYLLLSEQVNTMFRQRVSTR